MVKSGAAKANQDTKINLIFDKISYSLGETIRMNINLENFVNLNETRIIIKINEKKLLPLKINNQYGQLLKSSIYEEALLNEYVSGGYLRFHLVKKSLTTGYYSGHKNNIGEFYFEAKDYISNIYDLFQDGSFETLNSGINITLYDIFNQNIPYVMQYSEKMQVSWNKDKYTMEVYTAVPSYEEDIKVINRDSSEYEIIYQSDIDNQKLTTSVINVVILDKTNGDYLLLSKPIDVIDSLPPVITGTNSTEIESSNLNDFDETTFFEVTDNFDLNPLIDILYYDNQNNLILDRSHFIDYLRHHYYGYMKVIARDSSSNITDDFIIDVNVIDNVAPKITILSKYDVLDTELPNFKFENLIEVIDDYDENAKLYFKCYLNNEEVNYFEELQKGNSIIIKYYASDNMENKTSEYSCLIKLVDTTIPLVNKIDDIELKDTEVTTYDFLKNITYSDNLDNNPILVVKYYLDGNEKKYEDWVAGLAKTGKGSFDYYVKDKGQNQTEKYTVLVNVVDTTPPIIRIHNVKNNAKYTKLDKINYEIIDNFGSIVTKVITINDKTYENEAITEPGEYQIKIIATDEAGNTSEVKLDFTIIKDNFIGCGDDIECYTNNYLDVVIIACILMITVLTIIIVKLCLTHRKKKLR